MAKKQLALPGQEPKVIKAIEEAAEKYQQLKEKRAGILSKEIAAKGELLDLMKKHGQKDYKCGESDLLVQVVSTDETIKVKHVETDEESAEALA